MKMTSQGKTKVRFEFSMFKTHFIILRINELVTCGYSHRVHSPLLCSVVMFQMSYIETENTFSITFIRTSQGVIHSPLVIKQWYMLGRSLMVTLQQRLCNVLSVQVAAAVYSYKKGPRFLLKNDEGPTVALAASTHRMNRGKNFQKERSVSTSSVLIQ